MGESPWGPWGTVGVMVGGGLGSHRVVKEDLRCQVSSVSAREGYKSARIVKGWFGLTTLQVKCVPFELEK